MTGGTRVRFTANGATAELGSSLRRKLKVCFKIGDGAIHPTAGYIFVQGNESQGKNVAEFLVANGLYAEVEETD